MGFRVALIAGLLGGLLTSIAAAQITIVPDPSNTIHVTGRAVVTAAPDTATATLGVFARDLDLKKAKAAVDVAVALERLLDGAVGAGANRDFDVDLRSSRATQLKTEALALALANAKARADFAAAKLGLRVGAVRNVSLDRPGDVVSSAVGYSGSAARFLPGQIDVTAEASVTFVLDAPGPEGR